MNFDISPNGHNAQTLGSTRAIWMNIDNHPSIKTFYDVRHKELMLHIYFMVLILWTKTYSLAI